MADARELSTLASVYRVGRHGHGDGPPGVTLWEQPPRAIVQLAALPDAGPALAAVEAHLGLALPAPNGTVAGAGVTVLWAGPRRWLVVAPRPRAGTLVTELNRLGQIEIAVTDLSHARTVLGVSGRHARDLLAAGCSVDLHPNAFPAGASVVTGLARHAVLIHAVDSMPTFDLYVYRSFGLDLWEWLIGTAREYGYDVPAAVGRSSPI